VFDHSVFAKNRDRLIDHDVARELLEATVRQARAADLLSDEHFTVDGTLIEAWASHKSFKRKDGSDDDRPAGDFKGEPRANDTHASTTDPEARLARKGKGKEAKLGFLGSLLMDNRHDLMVSAFASIHRGTGERDDGLAMAKVAQDDRGGGRITLGADKNYDTQGFVEGCRENAISPHVIQNEGRRGGSALDGRTTRHRGYQISVALRRRIEKGIGWVKIIGGMAKTKLRGWVRVDWQFNLVSSAYNLVRMRNLADAGVWSPP